MLIHFDFSYVQELMEDTVYQINIYAIVEESSDVQIKSKELHEKVGPSDWVQRFIFHLLQVIFMAGALNMFTEEMDRSSKM